LIAYEQEPIRANAMAVELENVHTEVTETAGVVKSLAQDLGAIKESLNIRTQISEA